MKALLYLYIREILPPFAFALLAIRAVSMAMGMYPQNVFSPELQWMWWAVAPWWVLAILLHIFWRRP